MPSICTFLSTLQESSKIIYYSSTVPTVTEQRRLNCYTLFSVFYWLQRNEVYALDVHALHGNDEIGFILEVGLRCRQHLHDLHSNSALPPEKRTVSDNMLSPYICRIKVLTVIGTMKLIASINDKNKYIICIICNYITEL